MSEVLSEPCDDLFLTFVTTGPLLAFVDVELRHGHGIPEEAVASENG
jgi:hypothetical protein